jgi:nucleoside-diphosphate-sugar epimerase
VADADVAIIAHAQIGGLDPAAFAANTVAATRRLVEALRPRAPTVVHISSSVVNSAADDLYTQSKEEQEQLMLASGLPVVVLRPTLMFGWFDRKHLGWLARFMQRTPVFPIPGRGRYLRQPLYVGDVCDIIMACIERRPQQRAYNITGLERIDYIDLIRAIKAVTHARAALVPIPYGLFWLLLYGYGRVRDDPPFTTQQLEALATPDIFEVIDWPGIFGVRPTPFRAALEQTFNDPVYSKIVLEF